MLRYLINAIIQTIRPLLAAPGVCRFDVSCTHYCQLMLKEHTLFKALYLILKRVLSCHPLYKS